MGKEVIESREELESAGGMKKRGIHVGILLEKPSQAIS
jgi:hypothetical protein